ncbi:MAG: sulfotransferase [Novosphingobium sp.]|nr:sulfotransferase [Novosphingobium sp.]
MSRVSDLLDAAKAATGFDNFGDDGFREGLEILVESADREARLNDAGRAMFDGQCTLFLSRRLEIEDWYARHPEIDDEEIVAPLMVLGLPRTGSTALHCLLGEDPAVRVMRNWECMMPCPPPEAETYETDPRIALMDEQMKLRDKMTPRMKQMLPSTATSPTEDQVTMGFDFKSQMFQASFRIPTYVEWFNTRADLVPTFEYVKRVLKLLQWRCPPKRWRLKNPTYSLFIDALDTVFPDARYCMTHRDVANVIPSVADLYFEMGRITTDDPDKHWMGSVMADSCELGMHRMIDFRDRGNEHRFFDIHFAPFQKDPYPTLEKLYEFLGEDFTDEARARMKAWRENTPRDKHGRHEYDPADYGLDRQQLREQYQFYTERYDVPLGKD